jgi:hypothetical protein
MFHYVCTIILLIIICIYTFCFYANLLQDWEATTLYKRNRIVKPTFLEYLLTGGKKFTAGVLCFMIGSTFVILLLLFNLAQGF